MLQGLILCMALFGIASSPFDNACLAYAWGVFCGMYALVFAPIFLFILDLEHTKRVAQGIYTPFVHDRVQFRTEGRPAPNTRKRLIWTLDLLFNIRAIGWSHCIRRDSPWKVQLEVPASSANATSHDSSDASLLLLPCLDLSTCRLLLCTVVRAAVDLGIFTSCDMLARTDVLLKFKGDSTGTIWASLLWDWLGRPVFGCVYIYSAMDGMHSALVLVCTLNALSQGNPTLQSWMYPPLFGSSRTCDLSGELQIVTLPEMSSLTLCSVLDAIMARHVPVRAEYGVPKSLHAQRIQAFQQTDPDGRRVFPVRCPSCYRIIRSLEKLEHVAVACRDLQYAAAGDRLSDVVRRIHEKMQSTRCSKAVPWESLRGSLVTVDSKVAGFNPGA